MTDFSDLQNFIIEKLQESEIDSQEQVRQEFENLIQLYCEQKGIPFMSYTKADREHIYANVINEAFGETDPDLTFGVLEPILVDPDVSEILVNGMQGIFYQKNGELVKAEQGFESEEDIMRLIDMIARPLGRVANESHPVLDLRLADGSRVNVVIPPIAIDGPFITIRKFLPQVLTWDDLISFGSVTAEAVTFLKACVEARLNIIVSGGHGSGKSHILNNLMRFIPPDDRIITIESAAELQLEHDHLLRMESRPANVEGRGEISLSTLVQNALKMRPDRIILGQIHDREAFDLLQAMNTGIDGSMSSIHANNIRDVMTRMESIISIAEPGLPVRALREQMVSGIDLIVHIQRLRDGSRKILSITEVTGMRNNVIEMADIFEYEHNGYENNNFTGNLIKTGVVPRFYDLIRDKLPESFFESDDTDS